MTQRGSMPADTDPELDALHPLTPPMEAVLVRNHARFLGFLQRRVGSRAAAEELLQSALVRALEKGVPADDEDGAVNWFHRVLQNAVVDHHRTRAAETRALERESRLASEGRVDPELRGEVCACLHDLLPGLKPEYAEMVRRVDLEETPVSEVARTAGITANNASVRLHRARGALRKQLERMCGSCAAHGCLDCHCRRSKAPAGGV